MPRVAPPLERSLTTRRGYEITTPDRSRRTRGQPLVSPRPGVVVIESPPPGAVVEQAAGGATVLTIQTLLAIHLQHAREYWDADAWNATVLKMADRNWDYSKIPAEIARLDAIIARQVERHSGIAIGAATLKELRHSDAKRTYRMAVSRKNG